MDTFRPITKNAASFFAGYYLRKCLGFVRGARVTETDLFWKNLFRLKRHVPVTLLEETDAMVLVETTVQPPLKAYIRTAPSSDVMVFRQVFEQKEYAPLVQLIQNRKQRPLLMVDAGANVGYTTLYLKQYFPELQVVCVEPDGGNVGQIRRNAAVNGLAGVHVEQAGVWSHDCCLELKRDKSRGQEWGFYVVQSEGTTALKAVDIVTLPMVRHSGCIDILKMDVEGSEAVIFADERKAAALLSISRFVAIEIHDDLADRRHIHAQLSANGITFRESGELTIGCNEKLMSDA
jgi:FkbM family methyltransferase